jgi:protocatechuate 3,4-dioxygenase beta subunit
MLLTPLRRTKFVVVARRVARQARIEASRRRARERLVASQKRGEGEADPARDEIRRLVREELARLPERYRVPILLCDLHGLTRDEAARAIGCPPGTVAGRLARAREQLRDRLTRRGITSPAAWPAALGLAADDLARLVPRATQAALTTARGEAVATAAAGLAARCARGLLAARVPAALALLLVLGAAGAATVVLAARSGREAGTEPPPATTPAQAPAVEAAAPTPPGAEERIDLDDPATADLFAGTVVDPDGKPLGGAKVYIVPRNEVPRGPAPTDPGAVRAVTAAGGRFRFSAKDLTVTALDGLPARRQGLLMGTAPGYGPDWENTWGQTDLWFVSHADRVKGAKWTLTLARDDVPIRGRLLDPQGRPLAGATVTLTGLYVPRKKDLDGYFKTQKNPLASIDYDRHIETPSVLPGVTTEVVTDDDGRFRLDGLGRERIAHLRIRGPRVAETAIDVMTRAAPDVHVRPDGVGIQDDRITYGASFTLALKPGRTVTGVVRDKTSGAPLADVWVGPGLRALGALETDREPPATDAQGRFVLEGLSANLVEAHHAEVLGPGQVRSERIVLAVPKPGQPYFPARATINDAGEATVECPRGIPFRLRLRDGAGRPVEAEVSYAPMRPNSFFRRVFPGIVSSWGWPLSRAARQADGSYQGVALPGPGAVLVKTPCAAGHRPAHVDPKAFFAPGRTDWTPQELISAYGTDDGLEVVTFSGGAWVDQHDYAAIVLINPAEGSKPLELEATVVPDRPRQVTLLDPEGRPVVGASTTGLTTFRWDYEPTLRTATIPITGLHPDRARRITFVKEDRKLIGLLLARGDGDQPYTVRMQPWATLTGRVLDEQGRVLDEQGHPQARAMLGADTMRESAAHNDPATGIFPSVSTDEHGRFRAEQLVPGLSYEAQLYLGMGRASGPVFDGLKLAPGEVRDLGELRVQTNPNGGLRIRIVPPDR